MAMTLRLTDEQDAALSKIAETAGLSKQETTVRLIMDAAARLDHDARVGEASHLGRERYAGLLERLAK